MQRVNYLINWTMEYDNYTYRPINVTMHFSCKDFNYNYYTHVSVQVICSLRKDVLKDMITRNCFIYRAQITCILHVHHTQETQSTKIGTDRAKQQEESDQYGKLKVFKKKDKSPKKAQLYIARTRLNALQGQQLLNQVLD